MIYLAFSIGFFVWLIHRTEMIEQYATVLGIKKLLKIYDYQEWKANQPVTDKYVDYPHFIAATVKSGKITGFLTHLFGCPYCSITMLSLILGGFLFGLFYFLFIAAIATLNFCLLDFLIKK